MYILLLFPRNGIYLTVRFLDHFSLYIVPVESMTLAHGINTMYYTNDTQLCIVCKTDEIPSAFTRVELCLNHIKAWYAQDVLKYKYSKTELLQFKFRKVTLYGSSITLMFYGKHLFKEL